ncbi:MAG TPA: hypothetical protein DEQ03_04930 [Marinilabiliales bacterium]|nr:MAG: hypothetical protein A2437_04900 [Bacteroidetes bacterium RIFOXYC2_FULL_40_12]HCC29388.1 hypothetical protein [Marinilabiliales bacterium]
MRVKGKICADSCDVAGVVSMYDLNFISCWTEVVILNPVINVVVFKDYKTFCGMKCCRGTQFTRFL